MKKQIWTPSRKRPTKAKGEGLQWARNRVLSVTARVMFVVIPTSVSAVFPAHCLSSCIKRRVFEVRAGELQQLPTHEPQWASRSLPDPGEVKAQLQALLRDR